MSTPYDHVLHSAAGKFDAHTESKVDDVLRILKLAVDQKPPKGLLLHFHGGLVNKQSGLDVAAKLTDAYQAAGTYPVFFVWESGLFESLLNNKLDLARDPAFKELVKKVSEWVLKKVGGSVAFKGVAGQPVDTYKLRKEYDAWFNNARAEPPVPNSDVTAATVKTKGVDTDSVDALSEDIEAGLDDDPDFRKAMQEAFNAQIPPTDIATRGVGTKKPADVLLLSESAMAELFPREPGIATKGGVLSWIAIARFVARIVIAVLKRYGGHRDHGVYCTIVEEVLRSGYGDLIGSAVWNQMKKDTIDSFQDGPDFCGTNVIRQLQALEDQNDSFPQLTLVGHSTGAIYICNFLDAAQAAGLKTPIKVVFLAPALTHMRFASALAAHANTPRLHEFRMFAMSDQRECEDRMLGLAYTRSLLYFVSGLTEGEVVDGAWQSAVDMPIGGMQRYITEAVFSGAEFSDVKTVATFLASDATRTVWSPSARGPGLNSDSSHHGDFDDDSQTLASVQAFI